MGTKPDEDRIKLLAQLRQVNVAPDGLTEAEVDATLAEQVEPTFDHLALEFEAGDPAGEQSAWLGSGLEHGDRITAPGEFIGTGEPDRATAENGDLHAVGLDRRALHPTVSETVLGEKLLDSPDGNRLGLTG